MTVKSLTDEQKIAVARSFSFGVSITILAEQHQKSRRTIIRTLEELGINPGIKKRQRLPKPTALPTMIPTKTPWWRRVVEKVTDITQRRFQA